MGFLPFREYSPEGFFSDRVLISLRVDKGSRAPAMLITTHVLNKGGRGVPSPADLV